MIKEVVAFAILYAFSLVMSQTDSCSSVASPKALSDCSKYNTNTVSCCIDINNSTDKPNLCSQIAASTARIVNGTQLINGTQTYIKMCLEADSVNSIDTSCGIPNPNNSTDCTSNNNKTSLLLRPYLCCYSKITVAGQSKAGCVINEIKASMTTSFKSGGVEYTCNSNYISISITMILVASILMFFAYISSIIF